MATDDLVERLAWHRPAHRAVLANLALGAWMSAALDNPAVCDAMKADIREWFSAGEPMEMLGQALEYYHTQATALEAEVARLTSIVAMDTLLQIDGELYDAARPNVKG